MGSTLSRIAASFPTKTCQPGPGRVPSLPSPVKRDGTVCPMLLRDSFARRGGGAMLFASGIGPGPLTPPDPNLGRPGNPPAPSWGDRPNRDEILGVTDKAADAVMMGTSVAVGTVIGGPVGAAVGAGVGVLICGIGGWLRGRK